MVLLRILLAATVSALVQSLALAQEPVPLDERVAALERMVATLDTRLDIRTAPAPAGPERDFALTSRIERLEAALDRLTLDLQRVERMADNAMREASDARRSAMSAESAARDAAMRAR
jgi:hypothetical protein